MDAKGQMETHAEPPRRKARQESTETTNILPRWGRNGAAFLLQTYCPAGAGTERHFCYKHTAPLGQERSGISATNILPRRGKNGAAFLLIDQGKPSRAVP